MKKILIIISGLKIGGGAEKSATMVGNGLTKKGYEIHYLTFYKAKEKYYFIGKEYCLDEKISTNLIVNFYKLFKRSIEIKKYCKKYGINSSLSFMEEANFPNIISKFIGNKSKVVISIRSSIENSNSFIYKKIIKYLYPKADYITTISVEEVENLKNNYGIIENKISNIYNGIDINSINKFKIESLYEFKKIFCNGKFTFINIGRLWEVKNHKLLLNTFEKFNKKYYNTQLIILGDGKLKEKLLNLKNRLESKNDIHFLGVHKNPFKFLYNSDCFIFSSNYEGMGRVLIEALACDLPIISTDCKVGPKEVLRKNINHFNEIENVSNEDYGLLVPVNNKDKLFEAMEQIYLDEKLLKKYQNISHKRSEDFDISNIILEWEKIL